MPEEVRATLPGERGGACRFGLGTHGALLCEASSVMFELAKEAFFVPQATGWVDIYEVLETCAVYCQTAERRIAQAASVHQQLADHAPDQASQTVTPAATPSHQARPGQHDLLHLPVIYLVAAGAPNNCAAGPNAKSTSGGQSQ